MTKITYDIIEHDSGWAFKLDGTISETFPSHAAALASLAVGACGGGSRRGVDGANRCCARAGSASWLTCGRVSHSLGRLAAARRLARRCRPTR